MTLTSAKHPQDNRTYVEEKVTYDSFGNELSYTDENGLVSKTIYDPETGDETETISAKAPRRNPKTRSMCRQTA